MDSEKKESFGGEEEEVVYICMIRFLIFWGEVEIVMVILFQYQQKYGEVGLIFPNLDRWRSVHIILKFNDTTAKQLKWLLTVNRIVLMMLIIFYFVGCDHEGCGDCAWLSSIWWWRWWRSCMIIIHLIVIIINKVVEILHAKRKMFNIFLLGLCFCFVFTGFNTLSQTQVIMILFLTGINILSKKLGDDHHKLTIH